MVIAFHILHVHRLILTQFVTHTHHGFSRTDYDRRFRLLYYGFVLEDSFPINISRTTLVIQAEDTENMGNY
ncbi:hypothetical protein QR680_004307 [Steinernema hermaphroditum]|uniref:Secreted protein n=1 Tax=Steinernema hermaphroditum TaxID=289476 RepID=A0AA39HNA7_9BILA|nr:hypothetical protein QR680_004307 [Steinernema hermaphroditum]